MEQKKKINDKPKYTFEMLIEAQLETAKQIKEMSIEAEKRQAETDKLMKEMSIEAEKRQAETDKLMKEMSIEAEKRQVEADKRQVEADKQMAEVREQMKRTQKELGGIGNTIGKIAEETIFNSLKKNMTYAGIKFDYIDPNKKRYNKSLDIKDEYDVVMYNGSVIALLETKAKVLRQHLEKLATTKLENFRKLYPEYNDYEILLGVGGMSFEDGVEDEALSRGIGIIKVIGDKVEYYTDNIKKY